MNIHNETPKPPLPRMGYMSAFYKNGVVLRSIEYTHAVELALKKAGLTGGKEY